MILQVLAGLGVYAVFTVIWLTSFLYVANKTESTALGFAAFLPIYPVLWILMEKSQKPVPQHTCYRGFYCDVCGAVMMDEEEVKSIRSQNEQNV